MVTTDSSLRAFSYSRWFLIVVVGLAFLRLFLIHCSELFADEALYYFLSVRAPLTFCPHPPGVPFITGLGTALLGKTEMGARLFSFLFAMLTVFPIYHLARKLGGAVAANWSAVAYATTPIFVMLGVITTPDGTQLFAYALALLLTWKAMETGRKRWWIAVGALVGVALYVKYIIILYFPALAVFLLLSRPGRKYLRTPGPYLSALVAFLIFVPFFFWRELETNWAAVRYHLSNRQRFEWPSLDNIAEYQLAHVGYYSPILYGIYLVVMFKMARTAIRESDEKAAFLASFSLVPWLFFASIAAVTARVLSREQWDAPAYVPALVGAGVIFSQLTQQSYTGRKRLWFKAGPMLGALIILVVAVEGATGALSAVAGRKLLFKNLTGWNAMAEQADTYLNQLPADTQHFVLADSFAPTLEYEFYSENPAPVISFFSRRNQKYGLERVLIDAGASQVELSKFYKANAIFIFEDDPEDPDDKERINRLQEVEQMFNKVAPLSALIVSKGGRPVRKFWYWKCFDLR